MLFGAARGPGGRGRACNDFGFSLTGFENPFLRAANKQACFLHLS